MTDTPPDPDGSPPQNKDFYHTILDSLTPAERKNLQDIFSGVPSDTGLMRILVRLSSAQMRMTFGNKHRVSIVGPANVGKSTLYNQFVQNKTDQAEVSPLPGTTHTNQQTDTGLFVIVDTPGADVIGDVGRLDKDQALEAAVASDCIIILFDAIQGIKQTELDLYLQLTNLGKPYVVVLNKMDLVRKDSERVLQLAAKNLGMDLADIIPIVARSGENLDKVLLAIAVTEPAMVSALGQSLPQFRWTLSWRSILSAATISAMIALIPLPIIDFAPLIVNQSVMVLGIARIYNYHMNLTRARELVITFGLGFLARTLFMELSKLGGLPGWLLSASIAASTTVVMGYASAVWFEKGERLDDKAIRNLTVKINQYLIDSLRSLGKRRPSQKELQQRLNEALENAPMPNDPLKGDDITAL